MNDESPKLSTWQRSTTRRFLRWIFSWRSVLALVWVVSITALIYGAVDWWDLHQWHIYQRDLEKRVGSLDISRFFPKDDPGHPAPAFAHYWFDTNSWGTNYILNHDLYSQASKYVTNSEDLPAWSKMFALAVQHADLAKITNFQDRNVSTAEEKADAAAILQGMTEDTTNFANWRGSAGKWDWQYPVVYLTNDPWAILLPHLAKVKMVCQRLELMANAELVMGDSKAALQDILFGLDLADVAWKEPFLISRLVHFASTQILMHSIAFGIQRHKWTDGELSQLETRFSAYNTFDDLSWVVNGERAWTLLLLDKPSREFWRILEQISDENSSDQALFGFIMYLAPRGWFALEKLHYSENVDSMKEGTFDSSTKRVFPERVQANQVEMARLQQGSIMHHVWDHNFTSTWGLPWMGNMAVKWAFGQVKYDEAAIACALERYWLANKKYPASLDLLTPQFVAKMPMDVLTGTNYIYHPTANGFALASVGWKGVDDPKSKSWNKIPPPNKWAWEYVPPKIDQ